MIEYQNLFPSLYIQFINWQSYVSKRPKLCIVSIYCKIIPVMVKSVDKLEVKTIKLLHFGANVNQPSIVSPLIHSWLSSLTVLFINLTLVWLRGRYFSERAKGDAADFGLVGYL